MISDPTQGPIREQLPHEDNLYAMESNWRIVSSYSTRFRWMRQIRFLASNMHFPCLPFSRLFHRISFPIPIVSFFKHSVQLT